MYKCVCVVFRLEGNPGHDRGGPVGRDSAYRVRQPRPPLRQDFVRLLAGKLFESKEEKPVMTGLNSGVSGNAVERSQGNDRVDETLFTAEAGAGPTYSPTWRSASAPTGLDGDHRQYGT